MTDPNNTSDDLAAQFEELRRTGKPAALNRINEELRRQGPPEDDDARQPIE